jgi:glycosyltransferase involved in cell wall biosynthesis
MLIENMRKLNSTILYLHHAGYFSGAENSLVHLVTHLDQRRFEPIFLCSGNGEFPDRLKNKGIAVIPHEFGRLRDFKRLCRSTAKILKIAGQYKIHLLHSNGPQTNIPAGLAGRILGIPVIWHARNLMKPGMVDIDRIFGLIPHKIICNSEAIRNRFLGSKIERKTVTIINGVCLKDYDLSISSEAIRNELGIPTQAKVVGMTSRLGGDKGHVTLLEAVSKLSRRHPHLWVLIIGSNIFKEDTWIPGFLKAKSQELGIADRVVFTGFRKDVYRLYGCMDIFILATDAEPCGRVIFEAMAMAKPVIGTNNGGTPEIVVDRVSGFLFRYGDFNELAERIALFLDNPGLIVKMGEVGRKRIEQNFTIDKYIEKTQELYSKLIEGQQ